MKFVRSQPPKRYFLLRKISEFFKVLLNYSGSDSVDMSVVPQGAFAARKVRQNENKKNQEMWDLTQTKYSSKYMNSIWGMYNRYSVHNFKKNMDDQMFSFAVQQDNVGPRKSAEKNCAEFKGALSATKLLPSRGFL